MYLKQLLYSNSIFTMKLCFFAARVLLHLASEFLGSRNGVSCSCITVSQQAQILHCNTSKHTFVSIISDTGIRGLVSTREANKTGRRGASTTANLQLMTTRIELSTRVLVCGVQREELVADEVVAAADALGDGVLDGSTRLSEGGGSPHFRGAFTTLLLNLKPNGTV